MNDFVKTPSQLADEFEQTRRDAAQAARGHAREAADIGRDTVQTLRGEMEDARETGREALGTAKGVAADLKDSARDAAETGKAYARDATETGKAYAQRAADATGQVVQDWKARATALQDDCTDYVKREPVKGALIAAAGGAVLAMVLQAALRRGSERRYVDYSDY